MKRWIVCSPYDNPYYAGHPTGLAFTDKEKAEAYLREWEKRQCAKQWRNEMKVKTSEAIDKVLDYLVATCEGYTDLHRIRNREPHEPQFGMWPPRREYGEMDLWELGYSTDWLLAGPIIEREMMQIAYNFDDHIWEAGWDCHVKGWGDTPLVAAMRCYVASKLGDEVEVPAELGETNAI